MTDLERFKSIFSGLDIAYGQTKRTDEFDERGKHKTRSFIIKKQPSDKLWRDHLSGVEPALGIIPINHESKCKWACIDIDVYPVDHQQLINKIKEKNLPLTVIRSKSGGAHCFLFTDTFVPAILLRGKLKEMAAILGYAKSEIFPKQNVLHVDRGDRGSFLNLPYHNAQRTVRYAFNEEGKGISLLEFFALYNRVKLTEDQLKQLTIEKDTAPPLLEGAPPCLVSLATEGIPEGGRNNAMVNYGVYLKKRFPETWDTEIFPYNKEFCKPPLPKGELDKVIESIRKTDYNYKCKDAPIESFCDPKKCVLQKFGVGDGVPGPEIKEIKKYDSDPPIYYVLVGEASVEVDSGTLHEPDKFSIAAMDQIDLPMLPVSKILWRKMLQKLFKHLGEIEAPDSTKKDVQIRELLAEYINKAPGKNMEDVLRGLAYTENGTSYFKFKDFWKYLVRTKTWPDRIYPKQKTARLLTRLFSAKEVSGKIADKSARYIEMQTIKLDKPNTKKEQMKEAPFAVK